MVQCKTKKNTKNSINEAAISLLSDKYPVTKTFTQLHLSRLHVFPFKLHPTALHYTQLPSHLA